MGPTYPPIQNVPGFSPEDKQAEACSWPLHPVPRLRLRGVIPPLSHVISWRAKGQSYIRITEYSLHVKTKVLFTDMTQNVK